MHTVVIRNDVYKRDPWVALSMYKALCRAKEYAYHLLADMGSPKVSSAWLQPLLEEERAIFGPHLAATIGRPSPPWRVAMANQFVVQLKNEPGAMASLAEALASRGVDLRAIGGGGIGGSGHVIMTTADDEATRAVLEAGGYTFIEGESILAEVDDRPGGMARIARSLADAGVNIYGHLFLGRWGDRAMFAFVVDNPDLARPILERKG